MRARLRAGQIDVADGLEIHGLFAVDRQAAVPDKQVVVEAFVIAHHLGQSENLRAVRLVERCLASQFGPQPDLAAEKIVDVGSAPTRFQQSASAKETRLLSTRNGP